MRPEERLLANLADLAGRDLTQIDTETLLAGVRDAEQAADDALVWSGQFVTELRRRGLTWAQVKEGTGVAQTTLVNRRARAAEKA